MPARKTVGEAVVGLAEVTHGEVEAATTTVSVLGDAGARTGARDPAEGAADLLMAHEVAASGKFATAIRTNEFRRGMERADIAGQVQVAAVLLHGVANAMGGMAQELANDGADRAAGARPAVAGPSDKTRAATRRAPKPETRAAAKRAPRKPSAPKT